MSRELRENYKKNGDLAVAISCIFLSFSCFTCFHPVLMQHQCGDVTMKILEFESARYRIRLQESEAYTQRVRLLNDALQSGQIPAGSPEAVQAQEETTAIEKWDKKYRYQVAKQNKLLHTVLYTLMNMAEDIHVEKKVVNRQLTA